MTETRNVRVQAARNPESQKAPYSLFSPSLNSPQTDFSCFSVDIAKAYPVPWLHRLFRSFGPS